jgi:hypothetical protein
MPSAMYDVLERSPQHMAHLDRAVGATTGIGVRLERERSTRPRSTGWKDRRDAAVELLAGDGTHVDPLDDPRRVDEHRRRQTD